MKTHATTLSAMLSVVAAAALLLVLLAPASSSSPATLAVSATPVYSTQTWMHDIYSNIQNRRISDVTFPGTHDAGSYSLSKTLSPDATGNPTVNTILQIAESVGIPAWQIINPWALSQSSSILTQANNGARYFDVRCAWNGTHWLSYHFNVGVTIQTILDDIASFLNTNTGEIVVVELSHFEFKAQRVTQPPVERLRDMVIATFGTLLYPRTLPLTRTVSQLVTANQRAIVVLENNTVVDTTTQLWYPSTLSNSYANSASLTTMESYNLDIVNTFNGSPQPTTYFKKLSWTLTPQGDTIFNGLFVPPRNLQQLAARANPSFPTWAQTNVLGVSGKRIPQIILADYFESAGLVDIAVRSMTN